MEKESESSELNALLRSCADESSPGERSRAVLSLVEMMTVEFPEDDDEEEEEEQDDERGDIFGLAGGGEVILLLLS